MASNLVNSLLQNSLALDTEVLGLRRGAGMHELSVFNLHTGVLDEYVLTPNLVQVAATTPQETTRLATSALDTHKLIQDPTWIDTMRRTLMMDDPRLKLGDLKTTQQVAKALEIAQPWVAKGLAVYPQLLGRTESVAKQDARKKLLAGAGVTRFTSQVVSPEELFKADGLLSAHLRAPAADPSRGVTLWGANIAFDSKQIGALTGGLEKAGVSTDLKSLLQTAGPTGDPFYTTGVLYNQAKVAAQQTGDWTGVWKAMLADQPKAGEVAVRDIQDILRSMMSYGQKLGLLSEGDVYWGAGLDVQHRLMGSLAGGDAGRTALNTAEVHRAAEDLAIHSKTVLSNALKWTSALQEVHENTPLGQQLLAQAANKQGDLYEAANLLSRMDVLKGDIHEVGLIQRLGRAQQDILSQGETYQLDGWKTVRELTQQTPSGAAVEVPILTPNRVKMGSIGEVVNLLKAQGRYGPDVDIQSMVDDMVNFIQPGATSAEQQELLTKYLDTKTTDVISQRIAAKTDVLLNTVQSNVGQTVSKARARAAMGGATSGFNAGTARKAFAHTHIPITAGGWALGAAALANAGFIWSNTFGRDPNPTRSQPSLVTYNYQEWLEHQAAFSGSRSQSEQMEGMSERGVAGSTRRLNTDFGSPYQGIQGSQAVFDNQVLLDEREKWLRQQYGVTYFDERIGLFGSRGILASARHKGYSYIPGGTEVADGYQGLNGNQLKSIKLGPGSKWRMTVDDADTVMLEQGGFMGAIKSFFGMNQQYSFRLAGIDSPEIEHGQTFGAQPHAYKSMEAFRSMIGNADNMELVFDPSNSTYGRSMGVLFQGGRNVNYELVKQGLAGHLPFGKSEDSMINYEVMRGMEVSAHDAHKGMWTQPYWQAIYDSTRGNRPTFNTLTKADKIVPYKSLMDTVALAEQAQAQGFYSTANATEAARLGRISRRGVDSVRPVVLANSNVPHYEGYMNDLMRETGSFTRTKGNLRSGSANAFKARGNYDNFDRALVLDSMGSTNSVYHRRGLAAFKRYGTGDQVAASRRQRMQIAQQSINSSVFNSTQNHTNYQIGG